MSCGPQMLWDIEITSNGGPTVEKDAKIRPYIRESVSLLYCPLSECRGVVTIVCYGRGCKKILSVVDSGRDVIILRHGTTCLG